MSDIRTDVFLVGKAQPGVELPTLVTNLANAFKKETSTIERMLKRKRALLKANIEPALAAKYKAIVEKAGGVCEIVVKAEEKTESPEQSNTDSQPNTNSQAKTESQAKTDSLVKTEEPQAVPETSATVQTSVGKKSKRESSLPLFVVLPLDDEPEADAAETDAEPHVCFTCGGAIDPAAAECPHCFAVQIQSQPKPQPTSSGFAVFKENLIQKITSVFARSTAVKEEKADTQEKSSSEESQTVEEISYGAAKQTYTDSNNTSKIAKFKTPILVFGVFVLVVVTGILIINATPVYEDHAIRKKLNSALPAIANTRLKVAAFIKANNTFPTSNTQANLPENISSDTIESMKLQEGANLKVTFRIAELHGKNTVIYIPIQKNGDIIWSCKGGTLLDRYRDLECMDVAASQVSSGINLFSKDKRISLKIPASLSENHEIVPSALIGAANLSTEVFVVVLDESKSDFKPDTTLDQYTQKLLANTKEMITESQQIGEVKSLQVNNLPAAQFIVSGYVKGVKLAYVITVIESDKTFYRVLSWTMGDNLEKNKGLLMDISATFAVHN